MAVGSGQSQDWSRRNQTEHLNLRKFVSKLNVKIRLLALPLLSQLWLLSETLLWSEAGNVLFWRKDEEGENMSPILCFLASPPFTLFSTSSFSNEFT